ncbi:fluoride efflux transporter CrcB [Salinarimonas rosea]|uniref:fluoride efflux transporter CrcB n=1 Tax=Salinarimonas rosea TaxID=552063 RepID=UPI0003FD19FE|nr:fluoride efflux transporter CrcB [Salinarimonas rosea]
MSALTVFLGAGLGGVLRWLVGLAALRAFGPAFPWGTLAVNVAGSFAMGLVATLVLARMPSETARLFLTTGLLGGFTTFSAFSLDAAALVERGAPGLAAAYVAASVLLSLGAIAVGLALGRALA